MQNMQNAPTLPPHLRAGRLQLYQNILAILILVSIFLTLLLSLNFHIWSSRWEEDSLEGWVRQQEACIGTGLAPQKATSLKQMGRTPASRPSLLPMGLLPPHPFLPGKFFLQAVFSVPFFSNVVQCTTLCSLSVRINR